MDGVFTGDILTFTVIVNGVGSALVTQRASCEVPTPTVTASSSEFYDSSADETYHQRDYSVASTNYVKAC